MKVGINGFGRIGKNIYRILVKNNIQVAAINDPFVDAEYAEYLLRFDTVYGKRNDVSRDGDYIIIDGQKTIFISERNPADIPWDELGVDYVVEASGIFKTREACEAHRCKHVILTCPSEDIPMYVYGVNHEKIAGDKVVSAASCTTNCLAPIAKILDEEYGIVEGLMTTVHSVTASQKTTDAKGSKWRSARSCMNIIPATTGAAVATTKVLPRLEGRISGMAFRVPVVNGSVVDFTVKLGRETSLEKIRRAVESKKDSMRSVIRCSESQLVSSDIIGEEYSCVLDLGMSMELNPTFYKLVCWYDNEYGYSCRVVDLLLYMYNKQK